MLGVDDYIKHCDPRGMEILGGEPPSQSLHRFMVSTLDGKGKLEPYWLSLLWSSPLCDVEFILLGTTKLRCHQLEA